MSKKKKVTTYLEDVDITAIAMTSDLGACSGMNDPYLLKSKNIELTDKQIEILKKIGEYDKVKEVTKTTNTKTNTKEDEDMDEKLVKALKESNEALQKKLDEAVAKMEEANAKAVKVEKKIAIEKELTAFELEADLLNDVSEALLCIEPGGTAAIVKALAVMRDFKEPETENALQKKLEADAGNAGETEVVEKTLVEKIAEAREAQNK